MYKASLLTSCLIVVKIDHCSFRTVIDYDNIDTPIDATLKHGCITILNISATVPVRGNGVTGNNSLRPGY